MIWAALVERLGHGRGRLAFLTALAPSELLPPLLAHGLTVDVERTSPIFRGRKPTGNIVGASALKSNVPEGVADRESSGAGSFTSTHGARAIA